ncbi:hypothetical protein CC80DRAFT_594271 [Byssothecium circinans]|uniref:Uncharacterized protein n=1 Tax=Byssothecium circinans TaxID=147558 RepID=A0A6A5TSZ9_9PLEO|nr:hypothetical protein CC80DRAFT_594271 [Byssothecium circinans]
MAPRKRAGAKTAASVVPSDNADGDVVGPPKRELRKRKQINYKELTDKDIGIADIAAAAPVKKRKVSTGAAKTGITATTRTTVAVESTARIVAEDEPIAENPIATVAQDAVYVDEEESEVEIVRVVKKRKPKLKRKPAPKPAPPKRKWRVRDDEMEYDEHGEEIRKRPYEPEPTTAFEAKKARSLSEPLRFLNRERCDMDEAPRETFTIAGSMGNHYTVKIRHVLACSCPDFTYRRNSCKHIIYTLLKVLKVSPESSLLHQIALTSAGLTSIFDAAPAAPHIDLTDTDADGVDDPKRKSIEDQECPICYSEFEPGKERIAYCKSFCGNNVHQICIDLWLSSQRSMYGKSTCPYCRHDWVG